MSIRYTLHGSTSALGVHSFGCFFFDVGHGPISIIHRPFDVPKESMKSSKFSKCTTFHMKISSSSGFTFFYFFQNRVNVHRMFKDKL